MLIVAQEGIKVQNNLKALFYQSLEHFPGHDQLPFHEGFLKTVLSQGSQAASSSPGTYSTMTVCVIPKQQNVDQWISSKSKVLLGKAWLKLTKINSKASVLIKVFSKQSEKGSPLKTETIQIVPGLVLEICFDLNTFLPIPKRNQSPLLPSKRLKTAQFPGFKQNVTGMEVAQTSINQLKIQKPYLKWSVDLNRNDEVFTENTLGSMMESNKSLLLKDEFYGRHEFPKE